MLEHAVLPKRILFPIVETDAGHFLKCRSSRMSSVSMVCLHKSMLIYSLAQLVNKVFHGTRSHPSQPREIASSWGRPWNFRTACAYRNDSHGRNYGMTLPCGHGIASDRARSSAGLPLRARSASAFGATKASSISRRRRIVQARENKIGSYVDLLRKPFPTAKQTADTWSNIPHDRYLP